MAQRQQPGVTPDQIQRQSNDGVAEDFADQRQGVGRDMQRAVRRQQREQRQGDQQREDHRADGEGEFRAGLLRGRDK